MRASHASSARRAGAVIAARARSWRPASRYAKRRAMLLGAGCARPKPRRSRRAEGRWGLPDQSELCTSGRRSAQSAVPVHPRVFDFRSYAADLGGLL
jgi:hypothetical protein